MYKYLERKKSNVQIPSDSSQQRELLDGNGRISHIGLASPTELSFTGPNLPSQPFVSTAPTSPSHSQYGADRSRGKQRFFSMFNRKYFPS